MSRVSRAGVLAAYRDGVTVICELAAQFSEANWLAATPCAEWRAVDLAGHLRCVADDYHEYLDELEHAERMGFDGLCVNEHHNNAYGLMPSPNLMAAALARRTSRAALIVLGNSLAAYNPPLRVAEEFAMLDLLSRGRLVAGFPVGTSMDMNFAYGVNPATRRPRLSRSSIANSSATRSGGL